MASDVSFPRDKVKILLLEGIHAQAADKLKKAGYSVEELSTKLTEEELMERIPEVHVLGIRSKTKVNAEHLQAAKKLLVLGCFGIGTNQVDLDAARGMGIPVFNAPFGSTRSVAELAIGMLMSLARKVGDRNRFMHDGQWKKSAKGCTEIRGKTLGVVGYGNIGQQVGLLGEALGLSVVFYDKIGRLPLGNARQADSLEELLQTVDYVSLHVPAFGSKPLIGADELKLMRPGSYIINLGRGSLVDLGALRAALEDGHIAGAGIDVYPNEPKTNDEPFECELTGCENALLTPHLGGSTEEAQLNIGLEVASAFLKFVENGATIGSVNFPQMDLPTFPDSRRILNIHKNEPGVLSAVNNIVADLGVNIDAQYLQSHKDISYLIMDVNQDKSDELKAQISALPSNIKTRVLY